MEKDSEEKRLTNINPLLKVAIPIAFTIVGILFSTFAKKSQQRSSNHDHHQMIYPETMPQHEIEEVSSSEEKVEGGGYNGEHETVSLPDILLLEGAREISAQCHEGPNIEEQTDDMRSHIISIEERHSMLETQFYNYCNMKDQESTFQKLQIMCLGLKLELLEAENQKLMGAIGEVRETINQVDAIKMEFRSLKRNVKKLSIKTGVYSDNIVKEISRSNDDFCRVKNEINVVSDQIYKEIKGIEEKLVTRTKEEEAEVEENKKLFENLQQLREQWSAEMQELIYVGWVNACLRREILVIEENENNGNNDVEEEETKKAKPIAKSADEVVMELPDNEHAKSCSVGHYKAECSSASKDIEDTCRDSDSKCSRKPRLMRKIKGWAKGKEKCKNMHRNWDCLNS